MWWIRTRIIEPSAADITTAIERAGTERTAVDIEVPQRMHEIFQEERRAGHEHQQRHVRFVETEGSAKQRDKETERDQPDTAGEREDQPHRHLCKNSDTTAPINARLVKPKW